MTDEPVRVGSVYAMGGGCPIDGSFRDFSEAALTPDGGLFFAFDADATTRRCPAPRATRCA